MFKNKWEVVLIASIVFAIILNFTIHYPTYANESFFTRNHIIFYDKNDTHKICSDSSIGGNLVGNFGDLGLNEQGKKWLTDHAEYFKSKLSEVIEVNGVKKTRQERYIMAAATAGVPSDIWKILFVIDENERSFSTSKTILNGLAYIGSGRIIDGVPPGKDYQDDLVAGINHFMQHARAEKFDVKNSSNWTLDNIAYSLLRWNRGGAYHDLKLHWRESGYINNFTHSYQYNGKLDHPSACLYPPLVDAGLRCNNRHSKTGAIHILNFLTNNFTLDGLGGGSSATISSGNVDCSSSMDSLANLNGIDAKIMAIFQQYAHPQYHRSGPKRDLSNPAWYPKDASYLTDPILRQYTGSPVGQDCGAWVRFVIVKSGLDPNYGGGSGHTGTVQSWISKSQNGWQKITPQPSFKDISSFQPGDVGLCDQHTYIYIGNGIFSSASTTNTTTNSGGFGRFPMRSAGEECVDRQGRPKSGYNWWRKVK